MFHFFSENISFELRSQAEISAWLTAILAKYSAKTEAISYIFCSDEYLIALNKEHLKHDYFTDILTFPLQNNPLIADIYVSIDRVKDNAGTYNHSFEEELYRVMVHGILHLIGFDDHSEEDIEAMRAAELAALEAVNW